MSSGSPPTPADVDILVANAALPATGHLLELRQAQIDTMLEVNLSAPIALVRALAPGDGGAWTRTHRADLLAVREGRRPRLLDLQRHQVRPARLRARRA